ncbi:MAG: ribosomal protein L3 glutamine methyltransferase [Flavobacteriales bacterium]|jgi:ribosomal protein L3 glutamine methyltransferase
MIKDVLHELQTIRDWIRWGASRFERADLFYGHGTTNAWDDAAVLVLWAVKLPWSRLADSLDARLTSDERRQVFDFIERRVIEGLPVAYITGESQFAGLNFHVSEDVLIPRSPIAELIAKGFEPWLAREPESILDMCTGSGCIGIACAYAFPGADVALVDISVPAVMVATRNIARHNMSPRVQAIESDMFSALDGQQFDLIVSNPPYVSEEEYLALPQEYKREPKLGLTSGGDGLEFCHRFLCEAAGHLNSGGCLIAEVGYSEYALQAAYPDVPFVWLEFEHGGSGVFVFTREQLVEYFPTKNT